MKFPIVEPSSLPILIHLGLKYSPQVPYGEYLMKEPLAEVGNFKIRGRVNKVRFANDYVTNLLHGLSNPEVQCRIHKGSPIIPILAESTQFLVLLSIMLIGITIMILAIIK